MSAAVFDAISKKFSQEAKETKKPFFHH